MADSDLVDILGMVDSSGELRRAGASSGFGRIKEEPGAEAESREPGQHSSGLAPPIFNLGRARPSPRKARGPAGNCSCCVCHMSDAEPDLSDPSETVATPLAHSSASAAGQYLMCDHCVSLLRYQMGSRSASAIVQSHTSPAIKLSFLKQLATFLALKRQGLLARVQKVTLDKHSAFIDEFRNIHELLLSKNGLQVASASGSGTRAMGLADYVSSFGNPLINGDKVVGGVLRDAWTLLVMTSRVLDEGRYEIDAHVTSSSREYMDNSLKALMGLKVDDLGDCNTIRLVVSEYVARKQLQKEMAQSLPGLRFGMVKQEDACSDDLSTHRPSGSGRRRSESEYRGGGMSMTSGSMHGSAKKPRRSYETEDEDEDDDIGDEGAEAQEEGRSNDDDGGVVEECRAPWIWRLPWRRRKAEAKLRKRVAELSSHFTLDGWDSHLKGKEKVCTNLKTALLTTRGQIIDAQCEDLLQNLDMYDGVVSSCRLIIAFGKSQKLRNFDIGGPNTMWEHIAKVEQFFKWDYIQRSRSEVAIGPGCCVSQPNPPRSRNALRGGTCGGGGNCARGRRRPGSTMCGDMSGSPNRATRLVINWHRLGACAGPCLSTAC